MAFTQDWHSRLIESWTALFTQLGWIGLPNLRFLEIGCFEGQATVWLLENVLTHPTSRIDVIDTFKGSPEFEPMGIESNEILNRFEKNVAPFAPKVMWFTETSFERLCMLNHFSGYPYFDFIYVDGSHRASDVLTDAVLSWPLLKPGGILLFDDVMWKCQLPSGELLVPAHGIRAFRSGFQGQFETLMDTGDQLALRKMQLPQEAGT